MIAFRKYHGCGNNFVILDYEEVKTLDFAKLAKHVCDMHVGIGADGCIIVKQNPLEMLFYNQDGSQAPMCGNGIRCFVKYVCDKNIVQTDIFDVVTGAGTLQVEVTHHPFQAKVSMGSPIFTQEALKLKENVKDTKQYELDQYTLSSVFMGTIHTVMFVDDLKKVDVETMGEKICHHPLYLEKTNVNFVAILDKENIAVSTYERGVGLTKACGTGCCAAVVLANLFGYISDEVNVHLELGVLKISYKDNHVVMKGPAKFVAEGMCSTYQEEEVC